jgi:hypothetical protein
MYGQTNSLLWEHFSLFQRKISCFGSVMALLFGDKNCSSLNGYKTMPLG